MSVFQRILMSENPSREEQLGKRLVAMMKRGEERREELRTWELANINCRVKDIIAGVVEGVTSIDNQGIDLVKDIDEEGTTEEKRMGSMDYEELGSFDKEVDKEVDLEEIAEEEDLEAGVPLHLTASTAGFLLIFTFVALDFKTIARLSFFNTRLSFFNALQRNKPLQLPFCRWSPWPERHRLPAKEQQPQAGRRLHQHHHLPLGQPLSSPS